MLSVTGLNHFYYVRDFTDMRCKHSRVLSIIRERLHREPCDGDVFIVMSRREKEDLSNHPNGYKTMGVAGEMKNIMSEGYNAYVFIGNELKSAQFKDTVHQVCISHAKIFAYLDDSELPIDNNLAEQTIRKLTTQRNNSLHYGSDAGAEMAATYHSVIGTVKLHSTSVWNFIETFFKNIFNITLATGQY